jgi:hypothetical protein
VEEKTTHRVISIREKIEANAKKEATKSKMFSQYVMTGITQQESKDDICYIGIVYTVPVEHYPDVMEKYDAKIHKLSPKLRDEAGELVPVPDGVVERYEVYDIDRINVHVMYRVPYIHKPPKAG